VSELAADTEAAPSHSGGRNGRSADRRSSTTGGSLPPVKRIFSVDALRGLIMIIMALDHTREFVNASASVFNPEDLSKTTYAFFFTRWITHFCAPVFAFTAGLGAYLRLQRGGSKGEMSRFLVTRGLWLLVLEFTAVRFVFFFNLSVDPTFLLVFWMLGIGMIVLAALIHLPFRAIAVFSIGMIALHNLLDNVSPASFGAYGWIWNVLHKQGLIHTDPAVIVAYPLIPWIGIMAGGFCFGRIYQLPDERRRKVLLITGLAMIAAFIVLRVANVYGDPNPWSVQPRPGFTLLSFLRANKYPPSLQFVLMTLGPAIAFLGLVDKIKLAATNALIVFGRTPQFYFIAHLAVIHLFAIAMGYARYGAQPFLWQPSPAVGGSTFPAGYGWSLATTYLVWAAVVIAMYPLCRWLARLKASRHEWWLSYL
jgi:uncharacterized membrane protein